LIDLSRSVANDPWLTDATALIAAESRLIRRIARRVSGWRTPAGVQHHPVEDHIAAFVGRVP